MKRILLGLAAAVVAVTAILVYRSGGPEQVVKDVVQGLPGVSGETAAPSADEAASQSGLSADLFTFQRLRVDTTEELPAACLVFSKPLDETGKVRYEDYVRFDTGVAPVLRVQANELCLQGLRFAETYRVTLRQGMQAADGTPLAYEETIPVALEDRPPMVQFGGGLILPRGAGDGIVLTTVNVDAVDLRVLRVGDRLLSQLEAGLIDQRQIYSYDEYDIENERGTLVWEGQMRIHGERNRTVRTVFQIRAAVTDWQPGAYLVLARDAAEKERVLNRRSYYSGSAAQWIIDSDMGLTSFHGSDGLHVFVRSLQTAKPLIGVKLQLVARNNEILGSATTSSDGGAHFEAALLRGTGGMEPIMVMAYGMEDDFNYLDLRRPAFDLTDRGVGGRHVPGPIDSYLYTDRGIYRPGETVHIVTMVRDRLVQALEGVPVTLSVLRPDGIEYRRMVAREQKAGASEFTLLLSDTAPRGHWQALAYIDTGGVPVGRVGFDVQDFVPERLEVLLETEDEVWTPGDVITVTAQSRFLYGAPAAGLGGEAELKLMVDPNPFPQFPGYRFGRIEEIFRDSLTRLDIPESDKGGFTLITGTLPEVRKTSLPLRARLRVSVYEPGGRTTTREIYRPVRTSDVMIGIHPNFDDDRVREGAAAVFEVMALDREGNRLSRGGMRYRFVREDVQYQWYQINGNWQYERIVRDRPVGEGTVDVGSEAPATLSRTLPWGQYRLIVSDADGASSSVRFAVGWGGSVAGARPDRVAVAADKDSYKIGETARVTIKPPVAGKALLVVANDRLLWTRRFDVPEGGATIDVPVKEDWGAGAYVLVTQYKPLTSEHERAPVRSIGLTWLGVDQTARTLTVSLDVPDKVVPRQKITVPVTVAGLAAGERAFITLAAVDQGILQLTRFKSPDPAAYYFGKRRLAVDVRDDYGRLILDTDGVKGELRVGGDAIGGRGLSVVPTLTVALFSGLVELDANHQAGIELNLPDFVGELRLMAVAMSAGKVGMGERRLTLRDDVVADVTLPRFLAPGDRAEATLLLHNVDGAAGDYRVSVKMSGAVAAADGAAWQKDVTLAEEEQRLYALDIVGQAPGLGTLALTVTGPGDYRVQRAWPIEVRPAQLPESRQDIALMAPGERFELTAESVQTYYPETVSVAASLSGVRGFDVPGLLGWLDRYPYGCLEQTTSRAFPLLYYNALALVAGEAQDLHLKARVQTAVDRVLDMQNASGGFGMWGAGSFAADEWLGVFALDFLTQARARDYVVPQDALKRGMAWLRRIAAQSYQERWTRSYAFYVLAREGAVNASDLRYYADTQMNALQTALSAAQLGAALDQIGDRSRARLAFARAADLVAQATESTYKAPPYGSLLRDVSGALALAAASDETQVLPALFSVEERLDTRLAATTTQEKAWLLFAAYQLSRQRAPLSVEVSGTTPLSQGDAVYLSPDLDELAGGLTLVNTGRRDIWRTVSVSGIPKKPLPAAASGMDVRKSFRTLDGGVVSLGAVKQNERLIVLIRGRMADDSYREMIALDLLPAGWEIEAVLNPEDTGYDWLPKLTYTTMSEARDDRFVAAFDIGTRYRRPLKEGERPPRPGFALAYIVRAVTPGAFTVPAARVEAMYAPAVYARTPAATLRVTAAR